jgi:hypothetical protein
MQMEPKPLGDEKRGMSGFTKTLLGCGCLAVLGVLVCAGLIGGGAWYAYNTANRFVQGFESQGYERVTAQQFTESAPVTSKKAYLVQQLIIRDGSRDDLAIAAQIAELHGTFDGDIDFLGQMLQITSDAVVKGDIRVEGAQMIKVDGTVEGEISGNYQVLDDSRGKSTDTHGSSEIPAEAE